MDNSNFSFSVCTIVACNYIGRALVLHDSLKAQHAGVDFWLLLIDDAPLGDRAAGALERRGIHALRVGEIGLSPEEIGNFRFAYNLTEVSTAYKPWMMETVARLSDRDVFYIDPDIEFFAPMTPLVEAVRQHEAVLTPHVLEPMKRDGARPSESDIMGSGIYNLGFLGLNRGATRVTDWWRERLKREAFIAPSEQRFTDQRWMDFAPGLFDCYISKDETFNVAYWNCDQRPVLFEDGHYVIRGRPLVFFHYSGLDERKPKQLTRHDGGRPRVLLSEYPALARLVGGYIGALKAVQKECRDVESSYPFDQFPGGGKISGVLRRVFLQELVRAEDENRVPPPSPFGRGGEEQFFAWLSAPVVPACGGTSLPRAVVLLSEHSPDLLAVFSPLVGDDAMRLMQWVRTEVAAKFSLPPRLVPAPIALESRESFTSLAEGIELVGYLRTESGVGQAARLLARAMEASSVPFGTRVDSSAPSRQSAPFAPSGAESLAKGEAFECCVLCVNADAVASTRRQLGLGYFRGRPTAGLWFWEVEKFPERLHHAFGEVDEVWVATEFIRKTIAAVSPVPVHLVPLPFGVAEPAGQLDRRAVGIPDGFFFLFSFDFFSIFKRKNPLGLVEAFKLAFKEGEGPSLVIKGINGDAHGEDLKRLRRAAGGRKDIIVLVGYMDAAANQALKAACDCYVSLHRSEGLGLTIAEAMMQKKPVIATAYSGNMDFTNEQNSYLCQFKMVPVGEGAAPYCPDALWAEPDVHHAAKLMRHVYSNPGEAAEKGRRAAADLAEQFSPQRCAAIVAERWRTLRAVKTAEEQEPHLRGGNGSVHSLPMRALYAQFARQINVGGAVPSLGTIILQGPRKSLRKMLNRVERIRRPLEEALVGTISDHDRRLAELEQMVSELREQNARLLREQADLTGGDGKQAELGPGSGG